MDPRLSGNLMGVHNAFACEACGLTAVASGGPGRGTVVQVLTAWCRDCEALSDVRVGFGDDAPTPLEEVECPRCEGGHPSVWAAGDPCPRCGGVIQDHGAVALWD